MHPATLQLLPMHPALGKSGAHVICTASRYAKSDASLVMEQVACGMGRWVRHAREVMGQDKGGLGGCRADRPRDDMSSRARLTPTRVIRRCWRDVSRSVVTGLRERD
jgi:hypothetical protein